VLVRLCQAPHSGSPRQASSTIRAASAGLGGSGWGWGLAGTRAVSAGLNGCAEALVGQRERQESERDKAGKRWQENGLVFASAVGTEQLCLRSWRHDVVTQVVTQRQSRGPVPEPVQGL
jgi:hypothetical protein